MIYIDLAFSQLKQDERVSILILFFVLIANFQLSYSETPLWKNSY